MKLGEGTTPAPWHVGINPGPIVYGPYGEQLVDINEMIERNEAKANARLIAKAPLLIECRDVLERTHVHYCGKRFSFDTGDHCCEIGALLAKLEA